LNILSFPDALWFLQMKPHGVHHPFRERDIKNQSQHFLSMQHPLPFVPQYRPSSFHRNLLAIPWMHHLFVHLSYQMLPTFYRYLRTEEAVTQGRQCTDKIQQFLIRHFFGQAPSLPFQETSPVEQMMNAEPNSPLYVYSRKGIIYEIPLLNNHYNNIDYKLLSNHHKQNKSHFEFLELFLLIFFHSFPSSPFIIRDYETHQDPIPYHKHYCYKEINDIRKIRYKN